MALDELGKEWLAKLHDILGNDASSAPKSSSVVKEIPKERETGALPGAPVQQQAAGRASSAASRDSAQSQAKPVFGPQLEPAQDGYKCAAPDEDAPAVYDGTDKPKPPELVITPATVTLSPGGSVQYTAKLVLESGPEIELGTGVKWESSSALIEIDGTGRATAAAVSSGSDSVEITARHRNWETSTIAWVKVPSIDVRKFKTPFGDITYKADFAAQAKPRLENASKAFFLAEKLDNALDIAVEKLGKAMDKLPPLDKIPAMVVDKTDPETNLEAINASENDVSMEDAKVVIGTLDQMLRDTRRHVDSAKGHLQNKKDIKGLRELQDRAKAYDQAVDLIANSIKVLEALADVAENPGGMISAAADLLGTLAKVDNPFAKQADAMSVKLDDAEIYAAQQDLDDAKKSADEWFDKHQMELANLAKHAQLAKKHWNAVEKKYNTAAGKGAPFNFDLLHAAMAAAEAVSAAAAKSAVLGDIAVTMAEALLNDHPVPAEWLADEKEDGATLKTLLSESSKIESNANERQDGSDSYRAKLIAVLAAAHEKLWQGKS